MFQSILFYRQDHPPFHTQAPDFFQDLNLDQLIAPILEKETQTDLAPLYYTPLQTPEDVLYRQSVLKDLLLHKNREIWDRFSREICELAACQEKAEADLHSGDAWRCNYLLYGHILDNSERYCRSIQWLQQQIPAMQLQSDGLQMAAQAMDTLCSSTFYSQLVQSQQALRQRFDQEHYCMLIKHGTIRVKKYEGEENLAEQISSVFDKFRQDHQTDYRQKFSEDPYANHVEAGVLQCLSHIYPALFSQLEEYVKTFSTFIDPGLLQFCREIRFYLSWLDQIQDLMAGGLPFCFPSFSDSHLFCNGFFDVILAGKIGDQVVKNDFYLEAPERIFVVTGPNQGGKTTFARAIGQLHYLASLGLCIPGTSAQLMLPDHILTHFEREESLTNQSGKLQDDLQRLHSLLHQATDRSLILINEIFASTVLEDALLLGRHMMEALLQRRSFCVVVTFLDELAQFSPETVSLMSTVDPGNPEVRTYRVIRRPPDGLAHAMTLANKYGLTYEQILRRVAP